LAERVSGGQQGHVLEGPPGGWRVGRAGLAALVVLSGTLGCHAPHETLSLGVVAQPTAGLVFIADGLGALRRERLALAQRPFLLGRDALDALLRGEVEVAICYETPLVLRSPDHPHLRVLTKLHESNRYTALVARADGGIRSAADLRGRRVGVTKGTNVEFFLDTLLTFGGVRREELEVVDVPPADGPRLLKAGQLDALATFGSLLLAARDALGPDGIVELHSDVYTEMSLLVTTEEVLARKPEALRRLVRALARAGQLLRERPDQALGAVRERFPEQPAARIDAQWRLGRAGVGRDHLLVTMMRREGEWFREKGRIQGPLPDFAALLEPRLLDEVEPEAVTFLPPR
jgi:ABC-type nitrate/sulfonate/bicarbonate transport system substrate-binding protein